MSLRIVPRQPFVFAQLNAPDREFETLGALARHIDQTRKAIHPRVLLSAITCMLTRDPLPGARCVSVRLDLPGHPANGMALGYAFLPGYHATTAPWALRDAIVEASMPRDGVIAGALGAVAGE